MKIRTRPGNHMGDGDAGNRRINTGFGDSVVQDRCEDPGLLSNVQTGADVIEVAHWGRRTISLLRAK
jgi:hypothetical protein